MEPGTTTIDCWVVCEKNRDRAISNGYGTLLMVLKRLLGENTVKDIHTRSELRKCITERASSKYNGNLLIVGHLTDLVQVDLDPLTRIERLRVLELQFTTDETGLQGTRTGEVSEERVPYCSIYELSSSLSHVTLSHLASQEDLNEQIAANHAEWRKSILDPLLPLAVLVDGFLVASSQDIQDINEWFRPGIDAALDPSWPSGSSVATQAYWEELSESRPPVDRIGEMLTKCPSTARGFDAVLATARILGWGNGEANQGKPRAEAKAIHGRACGAVKEAWEALTLKDRKTPGEEEMRSLIEAASLGFHVLAAGCL